MNITEEQIKEWGIQYFPQFTEKYQRLAILTIIELRNKRNQ